MLVRLLGMVVQRFRHRFIVTMMVLVAFIAMPVGVRVPVAIGMVTNRLLKAEVNATGAPHEGNQNKH